MKREAFRTESETSQISDELGLLTVPPPEDHLHRHAVVLEALAQSSAACRSRPRCSWRWRSTSASLIFRARRATTLFI